MNMGEREVVESILRQAREGEGQRVTFKLNDERKPDQLAMASEAATNAKRLFGEMISDLLELLQSDKENGDA